MRGRRDLYATIAEEIDALFLAEPETTAAPRDLSVENPPPLQAAKPDRPEAPPEVDSRGAQKQRDVDDAVDVQPFTRQTPIAASGASTSKPGTSQARRLTIIISSIGVIGALVIGIKSMQQDGGGSHKSATRDPEQHLATSVDDARTQQKSITSPAETQVIHQADTPASRGLQLIENYREITGGTAYDKINHYRSKKELDATLQGGMNLTVVQEFYWIPPDRSYQEVMLPFGSSKTVLDGDRAWSIGMGQETDVTGEKLLNLQKDLKINEIYMMKHLQEYEFIAGEPETIAGRICDPVTVRLGEVESLYFIDQETGLPWIVQNEETNPSNQELAQKREFIDSYRWVSDVRRPASYRIFFDDEFFAFGELKEFEINPPVDPEFFNR